MPACHVVEWTDDPGNVIVPAWSPDGSVPPLFTDFTYDNLGVPKSDHKLLKDAPVDLGLGAIVTDPITGESMPEENGKFKVMTLRNIGLDGTLCSQWLLHEFEGHHPFLQHT